MGLFIAFKQKEKPTMFEKGRHKELYQFRCLILINGCLVLLFGKDRIGKMLCNRNKRLS